MSDSTAPSTAPETAAEADEDLPSWDDD